MEQLINRLGFGAYAENIIVNYIEDWKEVILNSEKGSHTIEKENYTMNCSWYNKSLSITIRAYVESDGWQTLEQNVTIK